MEAINSYSLAMRTPLGHDDFFERAVVDPRTTPAASSKGQSVTMPGDDVLRVNADLSMKMFEAKYGNGIEAARRSREFVYSMFGIVSVIVIVGTVGNLWVYGRIMPPLPDLVAGCGGGMGKGGSHVSVLKEKKKKSVVCLVSQGMILICMWCLFLFSCCTVSISLGCS
jgi:hypothetical protein